MSDYYLGFILPITVTFLVAGMVKGVTGMGLPTVAMGVLGLFMHPVAAASLLLLPSFATNIWQLLSGPSFWPLLRRLWPMMLAIIIGTLLGIRMMTGGATLWTTSTLGAALAIYAAYSLFAPPLSVPERLEKLLSPVIGLLTGLLTGGTGVFVIPAVPYIQSLGLDRENLVQALGLSFTVSTIALAIGLTTQQVFRVEELTMSAFAILPALVGMWLAR
jgi:uncharacterized membrane protein YfcA